MIEEPLSEKRLGAIVGAAWWVGTGWDAADRSEDVDLLLGFWWIRNRSIHDVGMLVRGYGGYADGYGGSAPPIPRQADVYSDRSTDEYMHEVWAPSGEIERSLTEADQTHEKYRRAYEAELAGRPVIDTIAEAVQSLGALARSQASLPLRLPV